MNRVLATEGKGFFYESDYHVPPLTEDEICVRAVMTGVCRSDIDMMQGDFGPLPLHMQGHEGLGKVIGIGANITNVKFGDYVATRGEPAYADIYNVRADEYVQVPEAHPRYIIEPVACGVNAVDVADCSRKDKILIIGSGFLAWVAYHTLTKFKHCENVDVLGTSNRALWGDILLLGTTDSYDVVIDLTGKYELGIDINLNNNALIVDAVGKAVSRKEAQQQLWKAVTTVKPSPRNPNFHQCMKDAVWMIENGKLNVDSFWTKGYDRDIEWKQAFTDGVNRPNNYSRGYIFWKETN
jgi:threonine dehydrogenase-like Zn-dependent dehydrogenase